MAAASRRAATALIEALRAEPWRFDFFQAVRILDQHACEARPLRARDVLPRLGGDVAPADESVRFRVTPSARFSAATIHALGPASRRDRTAESDGPTGLAVTFFGLTGPSGVLPQHHTTMLIEQIRANNDTLSAFEDLFNHRAIALFYRAWEKYRFPVTFERARRRGQSVLDDLFTRCVLSLGGFNLAGLAERVSFPAETLASYAGHFAQHAPNASALAAFVGDFLGSPATVRQFAGQWLVLAEADCSRLPSSGRAEGQSAVLGRTMTVGERVLIPDSRFVLEAGPLRLRQYLELLPIGAGHRALAQLVMSYVGAEFDFDMQLVLAPEEVPPCQIGGGPGGARLGWTSFIGSRPAFEPRRGARFAFMDVWVADVRTAPSDPAAREAVPA